MGDMLNNPGEQSPEELAGLSGPETPPESPEGQGEGQGEAQAWTPEQQAWLTQKRQEDRDEVRKIAEDAERRIRDSEARVWELTHRAPAQDATIPDYPSVEGFTPGFFEESLEAGLARSPRLQKLVARLEQAETTSKTAAATASMGHYEANPARFRHMEKVRPQIQQALAQNPSLSADQLDALYNHFSSPHRDAELAEAQAEVAKLRDEKKKQLESVTPRKAGGSTAAPDDLLGQIRDMTPEQWSQFITQHQDE